MTEMGESALRSCTSLTDAVLSNNLTILNKYLMNDCEKLVSTNVPSSCKTIDDQVFYGCAALESISIPANVEYINNSVFNGCTSLADIILEDGEAYLTLGYKNIYSDYKGLFYDCPAQNVHLGRWIIYNTDSPSYAPFGYIKTLKTLTIGESCGIVGKYCFIGCSALEKLNVPDCVESIGLSAFEDCSALNELTLGNGLISVGERSFANCTSLPTVTIPASLLAISEECFYGCTALKSVDFGTKLNTIGPRAFMNCSVLEGIDIPTSVYGLGVESFRNCVSLPYVVVPSGISSVGKQAFQDCTGIAWISLSSRATSIGDQAFSGCEAVKYIKSYNELPPEGLTGFSEDIEQNATLFVPEIAIMDYEYSPTWENFLNILPLTDDVLVTSVTIDITEGELKAAETLQVVAAAYPEEATNRGVLYKSSDELVATVDENGLITAVSVGEAIITAVAADGSGEKATCTISVVPTLVETITLNLADLTLKKTKTATLTATVMPETTTNKALTWNSSDQTIATVTADGVITALTAGVVTITASASDGSGVVSTCELTVVPPTAGDSNDDDLVTISDIVNTSNYVVGAQPEVFVFEAADVNADGRVTVSDVIATAKIVLSADISTTSQANKMAAKAVNSVNDALYYADEEISLDATREYVALQFEVSGASSVSLDGFAEDSHAIMSKTMADGWQRVIIYSTENNALVNSSPIVKLDAEDATSVSFRNVVAADVLAHEYSLDVTNASATSISGLTDDGVAIRVSGNTVRILNASGMNVKIYTTEGKLIVNRTISSDVDSETLEAGTYVVAVNNNGHTISITNP